MKLPPPRSKTAVCVCLDHYGMILPDREAQIEKIRLVIEYLYTNCSKLEVTFVTSLSPLISKVILKEILGVGAAFCDVYYFINTPKYSLPPLINHTGKMSDRMVCIDYSDRRWAFAACANLLTTQDKPVEDIKHVVDNIIKHIDVRVALYDLKPCNKTVREKVIDNV